jgi:hypothetical protein
MADSQLWTGTTAPAAATRSVSVTRPPRVGVTRPAPPEATASRPAPHLLAVRSLTYQVCTSLGTMCCTVTTSRGGDDWAPLEVFVRVGTNGSDGAALAEALGRLISLVLRLPSRVSPAARLGEVAQQLAACGSRPCCDSGGAPPLPCALAETLRAFLTAGVEAPP